MNRLKIAQRLLAASKFEDRLGNCYELAGRYVSENGGELVHGLIHHPFDRANPKGNPHAWVLKPSSEQNKGSSLSGDIIYDPVLDQELPKEAYEGLYRAKTLKQYPQEEVWKNMLRHKHWGPWH